MTTLIVASSNFAKAPENWDCAPCLLTRAARSPAVRDSLCFWPNSLSLSLSGTSPSDERLSRYCYSNERPSPNSQYTVIRQHLHYVDPTKTFTHCFQKKLKVCPCKKPWRDVWGAYRYRSTHYYPNTCWSWVVDITSQTLYPRESTPASIGYAPEPVWTTQSM